MSAPSNNPNGVEEHVVIVEAAGVAAAPFFLFAQPIPIPAPATQPANNPSQGTVLTRAQVEAVRMYTGKQC